jgi:diacylglycerol kinase family enzyme
MRTLVLLNPAAGGRKAGRDWPQLEPLCRQYLGDFTLHRTEGPGEATTVTRNALRDGFQRIVAVGGDGTNHEVVNGFFDPETRAAVAPDALFGWVSCGTGGDFRRSFPDLPKDRAHLIERIGTSNGRRMDLVAVTCDTEAGPHWRICLNVASAGQGGDVARRVNATGKLISAGPPGSRGRTRCKRATCDSASTRERSKPHACGTSRFATAASTAAA